MEKRLLFAAALSLGILLLWEWLMPKPPNRTPPRQAAPTILPAAQVPAPAPAEVERPAKPRAPVAATAESVTTLENAQVRATFSNRGAVLTSWVLLHHTDDRGRPLDLVQRLPIPGGRPLALEFPSNAAATKGIAEALFAVEHDSPRTARWRYAGEDLAVTKEIRLGAGYLFDVKVEVTGPPFTLLAATGLRNPSEEEQQSRYVVPATAIVTAGGGLERARPEKLEKRVTWPLDPRGFAGIEDNYFLAVLLPRATSMAEVYPVPVKDATGKPTTAIAAGVTGTRGVEARAYFGPKDVEILESLNLGLERTVDFGWFGILARPLLWLLRRTFAIVGNYGLAILLVTLLIRILLFPLMHKSYASMKKMQKLAPKMNAIREKYKKAKTDAAQRQKMNEELMKLYQAEGYNPMSGCFPLLLQMPILIAFYNVLSHAIELRHAPFVFWIRDLSAVDQSYVLLILMIVTMYVQQAMTPSTADPAQKRIFLIMPLVFGFAMKGVPSGLVLYWLFSNVLTILQQLIINRLSDKEKPPATKPKRLNQARA